MSIDFTFYTAGEIIFGRGRAAEISKVVKRFGKKALVCVRGKAIEKSGIVEHIRKQMIDVGIKPVVFMLDTGEPAVEDIDTGAILSRKAEPDMVIGLGGGSSIDTAKALAAMTHHKGSIADYLEGVGTRKLYKKILPVIAIPTTAGTGSEVTKNAVIACYDRKYKKSLRDSRMIPRVAILDPELTQTVPARVTAETGMDAFTQLIESYISAKAQPIPRALAIYGIGLVGKYLRRVVKKPKDLEAREGMMLASLLSGMALANSGLGAAHGIAAALGAVCGISHGRACAMLLPHVLQVNLTACYEQLAQVYEAWAGQSLLEINRAAEQLVEEVNTLNQDIQIPLKFAGNEISEKDIPEIVKGSHGSSMRGNPIELSDEQIESVIRKLL